MVKQFFTLIFVLLFFPLILISSSYAAPINPNEKEINDCFDLVQDYNNGYNYHDELAECLSQIDSSETVWNCNITRTNEDFGTTEEDIQACAQEFTVSICSEVEVRKGSDGLIKKFNERCIEKQQIYIDLFTEKRNTQLKCPAAFRRHIDSMSDGSYDEAIGFCSSIDKVGCLVDLQDSIIERINIAENNACANYEPSQELSSQYATEFEERYEIVFPPVSEEVQNTRDTISNVIRNCQTAQGNDLQCITYVNCLITTFERDIPASDAIWSCNKSVGQCKEDFLNFVSERYKIWFKNELSEDMKTVPRNDSEVPLNCHSGPTTVDAIAEDIKARLGVNRVPGGDLYLNKQSERAQLESEGEEVEEVNGLFPEEYTSDSLFNAFEELNCGFAGSKKNKCCSNTMEDLDWSSLRQTPDAAKQCFIPNFTGGCFISTESAINPILNFLLDDLAPVSTDMKEFLNNNGEIPQCFVGEARGEGDGCTCEPTDGAYLCRRYIAGKDDAGAEWKQYKPFANCEDCMKDNGGEGYEIKFFTALGCINTSIGGVSEFIFGIGIGIGGTLALFCIIFSAIQMQISQGNPEQIQKAQQNITSCITGLILIIFSVFVLRVIGVDILRIPGFTTSSTSVNVEESN